MLLYVNFHCFPHLGGSWIFPFCVWAHPFAVSLLFFFKIPAVYFISLIWLKKWPYAAHRAEVRSANTHNLVPKLSKVLPKLHQIFLKVIPNYLKVVSKLPSCSSQLVPKCCPCRFQMEPCDLQAFPSAAYVLSLKFPSGAKGSPFMLPGGHEMCWVERVPLALLRWLECLHMYNIAIEDQHDLKKWLGGGGGSLIGRES